jgi:hypothetical protein
MASGGWGGSFGGGPWGGSGGIPGDEFRAHVISSTQIRLKLDARAEDDGVAETVGSYVLDSLEPVGTYFIPEIVRTYFEDSGNRAIIIDLDKPLTFGKYYRIQVVGLTTAVGGLDISGIPHDIIATVPDPPRAIAAFQSGYDTIDLVFDRPVGPNSTAPAASIRPTEDLPGSGTALAFIAWTAALPENHLRFTLPGGMTAADTHVIDFANIIGESLNIGSGAINLELPLRTATSSISYADITQAQIISAHVDQVVNAGLRTGTHIHVYFNMPMLQTDIEDPDNWDIETPTAHLNTDDVDLLVLDPSVDPIIDTANEFKTNFNNHILRDKVHIYGFNRLPRDEDAVDEGSLIVLANDIRLMYEAHRVEDGVHTFNDLINVLSSPKAFTLSQTFALLNEIKADYNLHRLDNDFHPIIDVFNTVVSPDATDTPTAATLAEELKRKFNSHRDQPGVHVLDDTINIITASNATLLITAPDATTSQTAIDLVNEAQIKYLEHLLKPGFHTFIDSVNSFTATTIADGDIAATISVLNDDLYPSFNTHVQDEYEPIISSIRLLSFERLDPFYEVAEVVLDQFDTRTPYNILVEALDATSTSSTIGSPGIISIGSLRDPASELSYQIENELITHLSTEAKVNFRFDKEVVPPVLDRIKITDPNLVPEAVFSVTPRASLPSLYFFFDHLLTAYDTFHRTQSEHLLADTANVVAVFPTPTLDGVLTAANAFKGIFSGHVFSDDYHYSQDLDNFVSIKDATNFEELAYLAGQIREKYISHVNNATAHSSAVELSFAAKLFDQLHVEFEPPRNEESYSITGIFPYLARDNSEDSVIINSLNFNSSFVGVAQPPAIASALPEIGVQPTYEEGKYLKPDTVEGFISKPLRQEPLTTSNIQIPGVVIQKFGWIDDRRLTVFLTDMEEISYNFTLSDLKDKAGNTIL